MHNFQICPDRLIFLFHLLSSSSLRSILLYSLLLFFSFPLIPFSPLLSNLSLFKLLFFSSFNRCRSVSATWKLLYPWLEREREWGCIVNATTSQWRQTFKPTTVIGGRDVCCCCVNHFFFHWLEFCILIGHVVKNPESIVTNIPFKWLNFCSADGLKSD